MAIHRKRPTTSPSALLNLTALPLPEYKPIRVKRADGGVMRTTADGRIVTEPPVLRAPYIKLHEATALFAQFAKANGLDQNGMRWILQQLLAHQVQPPTDSKPVELPSEAPELWVNRDLNLRENAPTFIRRVYAKWLGKGLARKDVSKLDPDLYKALSVWLSRHKDDPIVEVLPPQSNAIDDLIERLSAEYSLEDLRKLGYAIDSRLRRKSA